MKRPLLLTSLAIGLCVPVAHAALAADPAEAATQVANQVPAAAETASAATPAQACLSDIASFAALIQKNGYWMGGSEYGYGYPMGEYGYGFGYPMGDYQGGVAADYQTARPGYETRSLVTSATILARNGEQQTCEAVLATARTIYQGYEAHLKSSGWLRSGKPDRQDRAIAAAVSVTTEGATLGSGQLIGTDVRNLKDDALGSVYDIVLSPHTSKIAYLIIARGGLFGFDQSYVPVPWTDFKVTKSLNLLVLDTTKAVMTAAPELTEAEFSGAGHFATHSAKVDAYWKTQPAD